MWPINWEVNGFVFLWALVLWLVLLVVSKLLLQLLLSFHYYFSNIFQSLFFNHYFYYGCVWWKWKRWIVHFVPNQKCFIISRMLMSLCFPVGSLQWVDSILLISSSLLFLLSFYSFYFIPLICGKCLCFNIGCS